MSLTPGTRLGPYAIESAIGAGGMGEVYRARDTRLDRTVAVKVLPEHVAADPELRQRFDREARTISSLNHPHICTLHDVGSQDGIDFLVMEYLEGETLAQRLSKGALPLDQALQIGIQIADALDKAHRQGIVHRDLKPGNVFLVSSASRRSGASTLPTSKLLDFGLAKLRPLAATGATAISAAPTISSPLTGAGSIVGTFQYMAPEQVEGQEADARTDIFAFGAVLYEMLTGKKAFEGRSQASLIAAILRAEPAAPSTLQPVTPATVDRIVTTCLAKDPDDRWQTARDLLRELRWAADSGGSGAPVAGASPVAPRQGRRREQVAWTVAAVSMLAALGLGAANYLDADRSEARPQKLSLLLPEGALLNDNAETIALSPDGTMFAFVATSEGRTMLWVRPLDSLASRTLPGTEGATTPFWAPDSRTIGFTSLGRLRKVRLSGTPPETIRDVPILTGATWNRDDVIVYSDGITGVLYQVSASGGEATAVTVLDEARDETGHVLPSFLPDGRHFLYHARSQGGGEEGINIGSLDSPMGTRLLSADSGAIYAPSTSGAPGHLLFVRANALLAQPFDTERLELTGEAVAIAEGQVLPRQATRRAPFSASDTGALAYVTGNLETQLAWFDRGGVRQETLKLPPGGYTEVQLSPDGTRVAIRRRDLQSGSNEIWVLDLSSERSTPVSLRDADQNPRWSPDGRALIFLRRGTAGSSEIIRKPTDGTETEEVLTRHEDQLIPSDWSPDGRSLVFRKVPSGDPGSLWVPLSGDKEPWAVAQTEQRGLNGRFSPDGRWLAYTAEATGQAEVYVQSFPQADRRLLASRGGGLRPVWRRDGRELYFVANHPTTGARTLLSVAVEPSGQTLRMGAPQPLMGVTFNPGSTNQYPYAVAPDGQRFLMIEPVDDRVTEAVTVVLNWAAGLPAR